MSVMRNFENSVEGAVDGAAAAVFSSPIEPAQIAKKAEKQMKREKLVGSGRQYAPTLYNVLVNERDDKRLFGFYPTMAAEIENYLYAKGTDARLEFDTRPLVRFIPDPGLKKGRFDVIAEVVAAPIIKKLRAEEMEYYGLAPKGSAAEMEKPKVAPAAAQAAGNYNQQNRGYSGTPVDGKFAGLDMPADIEDLPCEVESSALLSLPLRKTPAREAVNAQAAGTPDRANQNMVGDGGDQSAMGRASLFNASENQNHRLTKRKLTVGRGKDNDITIADANASRVHARFSQDATGKWKLSDLDSTNGTQLNGRQVTSAILKSGDEITIGTTLLQFSE